MPFTVTPNEPLKDSVPSVGTLKIAPLATETSTRLVLEKYTLYETKTRFYIVASNQADSRYRVLKIDRTTPTTEGIAITEDAAVYSHKEITDLLGMIDDGNKALGGLIKAAPLFYGIVGFTRFTGGWYMLLIKHRQSVGLIAGHYIYHCEETFILPIDAKPERSAEESRLLQAFQHVELSKNFYFSYTYDLTNTLQFNMVTRHLDHQQTGCRQGFFGFNDKYIWNHYLLKNAFKDPQERSSWVLPLIHGFVDQFKLSVYGRIVYVTLIARRSRHYAGARFLKRGINEEGHVANDVETEQIVSEALTTPFHTPLARGEAQDDDDGLRGIPHGYKLNPRYTSFVQYRGSIPIAWQQDASGMQAKPPIDLGVVDPFFSAAALHFDDLFERYGTPVIVLNLIKTKESIPRESKLLPAFVECINYLNLSLPKESKIRYVHFDMATANRKRNVDVLAWLEDEAQQMLDQTNFFHSGGHPAAYAYSKNEGLPVYRSTMLLQSGVCRTNCIDCIDRTNAAQFTVGKVALGRQLHALGILPNAVVPFHSDASQLLTEMYHDHGDTLALQYGGSNLVNTIDSYHRMKQWSSHSRDMIEGLKRYYANSFSDADKQKSINLYLGQTNDTLPLKPSSLPPFRHYIDWYTPSNLERIAVESKETAHAVALAAALALDEPSSYWTAYYRPRLYTHLDRHFAYTVNNALKYAKHTLRDDAPPSAQSPFLPRIPGQMYPARNKKSATKKKPRLSDHRQPTQIETAEEAALPPATTTEGLSMRLLQPSVGGDMAEEYYAYTIQTEMIVSEADRKTYAQSVAILFDARATVAPSKAAEKLYYESTIQAIAEQGIGC